MKLTEIFGTTSFQSKESALFNIKRGLPKGHFLSFAERAGVQTPLFARLIYIFDIGLRSESSIA